MPATQRLIVALAFAALGVSSSKCSWNVEANGWTDATNGASLKIEALITLVAYNTSSLTKADVCLCT